MADHGSKRYRRATLEQELSRGAAEAARAVGAHGCGVFVPTPDRRSLALAAVAGLPPGLVRSWWRLPLATHNGVTDAYRTGQPVYVTDSAYRMRHYPQQATEMPYPFGSAAEPVLAGGRPIAVLLAVLPETNEGLSADARQRLRALADRLGTTLSDLAGPDGVISYDAPPIGVPLIPKGNQVVRIGLFGWQLADGKLSVDAEARAIFGLPLDLARPTVSDLARRLETEDVATLHACAREAAETGRVRRRELRVRSGPDRARTVELWGRLSDDATRLETAVVDLGTDTVAAEAAERLPDGIFALDQEGRLIYANHHAEELLRTGREELLGRQPWDVLPWLSDPAYEDRYRAAMFSQAPGSFVVREPGGSWLRFVFYPDSRGLTGRVVPTGPPESGSTAEREMPPPPPGGVVRAGALYRVVQMASLLTESVTVLEVCKTVTDHLLPSFGGQECAIYTMAEGRMFRAWEVGFPEGFLDQFEGVTLHASLPGVHTLTSGKPIFFESPDQLADAYPGIARDEKGAWAFLPLIASGRPVGSCILGYDAPRPFTREERAALTALAGLVAQALERARLYDSEYTLARGLQNVLLPHRLPDVAGLECAARYLPGTQGMEIGGDWYDVIRTADGVALVIGDVEGHNVTAAGVMGQLRSAFTALATSGHPPDEVVGHANRLLIELEPDLCASCCYILLEPATGTAHAVRAGHPPPLLRHGPGRARVLDLPGGPLLGADPDGEYPMSTFQVPVGATLVLYTDGLVEVPDQDLDTGITTLCAFLRELPDASLESLTDHLLTKARQVHDRPDDVALLLSGYAGRA